MKKYIDIAYKVLNHGKWKGNRTGERTLVLPNQHFSHNMYDGFPLLTTKAIAKKTMATELEGFIKGITSKKWYQDRGCKIWNQWCNPEQLPKTMVMLDVGEKEVWEDIQGQEKLDWQRENSDLGPLGYSHQWRNFNGNYKPLPFIWTGLDKGIVVNFSDSPHKIVGNNYDGKYGIYTVISYDGKDDYHNARYTVKFENTGFVKHNLSHKQIIDKTVFDPYFPNVVGVACVGEYNHDHHILQKLQNQWKAMVHRCYNKDNQAYKNYGAKGIYVHNRWLIYSNFLEDVQSMENWHLKFNNWDQYQLDKDILGGKCYSKDNCLWVNRSVNANHTNQNYFFDAIDPNGKEYKYNLGLARFCRQYNLNTKTVEASIKNQTKTHDGWCFIRKKNFNTSNNITGYDQFDDIVQKLKNNPNDRRLVCSAWNPLQNQHMALPPCHLMFVLTHINGELSLHWTQRSCDLFLGVPFNIASYGLLLELLCKESGMKARNLSGMLCDCHIYEGHIEAMQKQLSRNTRKLPNLELHNWNGIYNWQAEDAVFENYYPHPAIKAKVAV